MRTEFSVWKIISLTILVSLLIAACQSETPEEEQEIIIGAGGQEVSSEEGDITPTPRPTLTPFPTSTPTTQPAPTLPPTATSIPLMPTWQMPISL